MKAFCRKCFNTARVRVATIVSCSIHRVRVRVSHRVRVRVTTRVKLRVTTRARVRVTPK